MVIRKEGYNIIAQPERNVQHRALLESARIELHINLEQ